MRSSSKLRLLLGLVVVFLAVLIGCCNQSQEIDLQSIIVPVPVVGKVVVYKFWGDIDADWAKQMEKGFQDKDVKAVLMWMDSPGGTIVEARLLAHNLNLLRVTYSKPLYVFSEYALYSGAYWAACYADSIFVAPSGGTGSIGVYSQRLDAHRADSASGMFYYTFRSGALKAIGDQHVPMTPQEFDYLFNRIKVLFNEFFNVVVNNRFNELEAALVGRVPVVDTLAVLLHAGSLMDGRGFSAYEAKAYGLIDGVGYFDQLVAAFEQRGWEVVNRGGDRLTLFYKE